MFRSRLAWLYLIGVALIWAAADLIGERTLPTLLLAYTPALVWLLPAPLVVLWTLARRRGLAVALAGTLLAAWSAGLLHWRPQTQGELRVLTFNVARGYQTTPQRLGALLAGSRADIILLQEANFAEGGYDEALARALPGYRVLRAYETTTLTRLPVISSRKVNYPSDWREVLVTRVRWRGQPLSVVNAHPGRLKFGNALAGDFTLLRPSLTQRAGQIETVLDVIGGESGLLLLGGDLNTPPRGLTYRALRRAAGPDAFEQAGRGPGWTFPSLKTRIDHQLSRGLTATRARVLDARESDHRPLLVEYR
ncbi:hypothetical protein CVO96_12510 [Deinococcus koreensis]|uniref:Endonuclease/exonuclease/phosphatase domain-containing protein n=1 Tax=Deinococcus koreensis TaxID=2054903 RepID=A0A2K3V2Q4_9DEIO|nr:hypothetical protein CVO96_12510 [Deinococcus koreensis]